MVDEIGGRERTTERCLSMKPVLYRMINSIIVMILLAGCATPQITETAPTQTATELPAPTATASIQPTATISPTPTVIPYTTPDWFRSANLYLIFVRSFADSNGDEIGDIDGVTQNLDYLQSLAIDTLWLMPIHPSPSVHGYDVTDFYGVNPEYGTLQDVQELVAAAHERDMKIILDFVPSHLSDQHPLFQEVYGKPEADKADWFVFTNDSHTQYAGFAGLREMPRFNHYNPEVVDYLTEAALYWLDLDGDGDYSDGIDGLRIDNATFPPQEFFYSLRQSVKAVDPETVLLGETWVNTPSDLNRYFEDQFDALFDFPFQSLVFGNKDFNGDGLISGKTSPGLLGVLLNDQAQRYSPEAISVRFASNHDTNRIASEVGGDMARLRLTPALQFLVSGTTMVYYGEELGMFGQKGGPPHWDSYRREPMDWYAMEEGEQHAAWFMQPDRWNQPLDGISVEEQDVDPDSLLNYYRHLLGLRQLAPIASGETTVFRLAVDAAGPWAMLREIDGEYVLGVFNFSAEPRVATMEVFPDFAGGVWDLISGEEHPEITPGAPVTWEMQPFEVFWFSNIEPPVN